MSDDENKKEEPKPFTKGWKPPKRQPKYSDEQVMQALEKTNGHIANAARLLDYKPGYLRNRISDTPELTKFKNELIERRLDDAEDKLQEHIYDRNNLQALVEYLKAVGRRRGYGSATIDMNLEGKMKHSLDDEIAKGLVDKFLHQLEEEEDENE